MATPMEQLKTAIEAQLPESLVVKEYDWLQIKYGGKCVFMTWNAAGGYALYKAHDAFEFPGDADQYFTKVEDAAAGVRNFLRKMAA